MTLPIGGFRPNVSLNGSNSTKNVQINPLIPGIQTSTTFKSTSIDGNSGAVVSDYSGVVSYTGPVQDSESVDNGDGTFTNYNENGTYLTSDGKTFERLYNSSGELLHEVQRVIDENGNITSDITTFYEYGDNGERTESVYDQFTNETTSVTYDADGNRTEKLTKKGTVTTYYDANDKPIRRETDKGYGIVVTEDLTE